MEAKEALGRLICFEKLGLLIYETDQHRSMLQSHLQWMDGLAIEITINAIESALHRSIGYVCKVIRASNLGVHFSRDYEDWKVVGWIELLKGSVNLNLVEGVNHIDINVTVVNAKREGTPHPLVLKLSKPEESKYVSELLKRSERKMTW